jgi:hypothetical protein
MAEITADQLNELVKERFAALQKDLQDTRAEMHDTAKAMRGLEVQLAKIDVAAAIARQDKLQDRISQFEKQAVTESDLAELRRQVAELVADATGRKAQAKMLRWVAAGMGVINVALLIYLNWKKI